MVPGLRQECLIPRYIPAGGWGHAKGERPCIKCQGRGWVLKPEAEQLGALYRHEKQLVVWRRIHGGYIASCGGSIAKGETPEEAAAGAICQAHGLIDA